MVRRARAVSSRGWMLRTLYGAMAVLLVACSTETPTPTPPPASPTQQAAVVNPTAAGAGAGAGATPAVGMAGSAVAGRPIAGVSMTGGAGSTAVPGAPAAPTAVGGGTAPAGGMASAATLEKIDDVFLEVLNIYQTMGQDAAVAYARDQGLLTAKNEVRLTLILDTEDRTAVDNTALNVTRLGGRVTATSGVNMEVLVPMETLTKYAQANDQRQFFADLAEFQHVRDIRRTPRPTYNVPAANGAPFAPVVGQPMRSEGIAAVGADKWQMAGITGKGVKVGIIDGSFTGYKRILRNPAQMKTRSFRDDDLIEDEEVDGGSVHGTGVAEVIQGIAPDAQLILVAVDTPAGFANAVDYLVQTERVALISSSLGWEFGRKDGTSVQAKAADRARAAGVSIFIAAGNEADAHYETKFADTDRDGLHDFPMARARNGLRFATTGGTFRIILNWPDQKVRLDLLIVDGNGKVVSSARDTSKAGGTPEQVLFGKADKTVTTVRVRKVNASDPDPTFDMYVTGGDLEINTGSSSLSSPGDAKGAFTIGAADVKTGEITSYSSQGPTDDGRKKPEFSGPTNVSSQAYMLAGRRTFGGTSAATPHAAGVAALYMQAFPQSKPDDVGKFLAERARRASGSRMGENIAGAGIVFLGDVPVGANTVAATIRPATARPTGVRTTPGTTPVPRVTPTAMAAATAMPGVFTDDFTNPRSGLPMQGYRMGEYRIAAQAGRTLYVSYDESVNVPRLTYEVTTRRVAGPTDAGGGLIVRELDEQNYLMFVALGNGVTVVLIRENNSVKVLAQERISGVNANGPNTLRVVAEGERFTFSVNGRTVIDGDIAGVWAEGAFGLQAVGGDTMPAEIAFTKFSVSAR